MSGLHRSVQNLEKDILKEKTIDTTAICIQTFSKELKRTVSEVSAKYSHFQTDLIEPLDLFSKHYQQEGGRLYHSAQSYWNSLGTDIKNHDTAQQKYY